MKSYHDWKQARDGTLDEIRVGDGINFRKVSQGVGTTTTTVNPTYITKLKQKVDDLWDLKIHMAERDNPGSTMDPGRLRQLQDDFIRELIATVTYLVRGSDTGRRMNYYSSRLNSSQGHQPTQTPPAVSPAKSMGQGPQLR